MASRDIILYHYTFSPYARRIVWYLNLRQIPYSECIQPLIMPRPDLTTLGISYRRIPVLAIGRDIYHDTRLIIAKLNTLFPPSATHPPLASPLPSDAALEELLRVWATDGGLFARAGQLIPPNTPLLKDPSFTRDRAQMSGRPWTAAYLKESRPEALVAVRAAIEFLETGLLADGRAWILQTQTPSLADLEAVWPLHWVLGMPGALPADVASKETFPRVFAWVARFQAAVKAAREANAKPKALKGFEAAEQIWESGYAERLGNVDSRDPSGLKRGQDVLVHPTDSGISHKDRGTLLALDGKEIVIEVKGERGMIRVHAPRHGFRVVPAVEAKL